MKKTNETVYRCDFCNKAMVSAGFMKLHERMCKKNPNNKHKCFEYCKNLVKESHNNFDEEGNGHETSFHCKLNPDIELYSYKLERYKSNKDRLVGLKRMPLECDLYVDLEGDY